MVAITMKMYSILYIVYSMSYIFSLCFGHNEPKDCLKHVAVPDSPLSAGVLCVLREGL